MVRVGAVLERAARATPSADEDRGTRWWLRHAGTGAWWSGATLAHGPDDHDVAPERHTRRDLRGHDERRDHDVRTDEDLARRVDAAERFYAERNAVARFQVCPDCPRELDATLAARGYRVESVVLLLTAPAHRIAPGHVAPGVTARVDDVPTPTWLSVARAGDAQVDDDVVVRGLCGIRARQAFVTVSADGVPVGIARAVADDGWTGVFGMLTSPAARRRGVARLALGTIASWADAHDAPRLYLQVEEANERARRLYASVGFVELARYHYRVRTPAGGA